MSGEQLIIHNETYRARLAAMAAESPAWRQLAGASVLVAGARGMIASCLVDYLMYLNEAQHADITVYAMGRGQVALEARFSPYLNRPLFHAVAGDVAAPLGLAAAVDYIVHAASDAHPLAFASDPVGVMRANFLGTDNLLQYAKARGAKRLLYLSSGEVYGQSTGEAAFTESYSGPVDSTDPRACYPLSKRASETLCVCYQKQFGAQSVIVRPCHIYGPTIVQSDSRVIAQFVRDGRAGRDIVMKSTGSQVRSYCYVSDCVTAMLHALVHGEAGSAYNISNAASVVSVRQLAEGIAREAGTKVVFDVPDATEKSGYSKVVRAVLDPGAINATGWKAAVPFDEGIAETYAVLCAVAGEGALQ